MPGRLTAAQVASVLNFAEHDIPPLMGRGLLVPLGTPKQNCSKYFASIDIEALRNDRNWLNKATDVVYAYHAARNASQNGRRKAAAHPRKKKQTPKQEEEAAGI